jgi:hypothetical protein
MKTPGATVQFTRFIRRNARLASPSSFGPASDKRYSLAVSIYQLNERSHELQLRRGTGQREIQSGINH